MAGRFLCSLCLSLFSPFTEGLFKLNLFAVANWAGLGASVIRD